METLIAMLARVGEMLAEIRLLGGVGLSLLQRDTAVVVTGGLAVVALGMLVWRYARQRKPGAANIVLPALPARRLASRAHLAPVRHLTFAIFLAGLALFIVALADPHTALVQEEESYPGHRIAILIDASLSMNTAFATQRLAAGNTFLANVAAAEYFVRRRMEGPYHDLTSLVQFGNEAYIVTPFTTDYENILLSISLIGTPEEYRRFPDHGTLVMNAISRGVQLFRTFDFLGAAGNLMVIFSDGQDTHARFEDLTLGRHRAGGRGQRDPGLLHPHGLRSGARGGHLGPAVEAGRGADRRQVLSGGERGRHPGRHPRDRRPGRGAYPRPALHRPRAALRPVRARRGPAVADRAGPDPGRQALPEVSLMKAAFQYLVAALILGGIAAAVAAAGRLDRRVARAEQQIATFAFDDAEAAYGELERSLDVAGTVPWLFGGTRADVESRRAALRYWRGDYGGLLADYTDVSSPDVSGNLSLQFILANAAARAALDPDADREQVLRALDGAIDVYLGVLQESPGHLDAAYNYEYLLRLRADIASGAQIPAPRRSQHGREGEAPEDGELEEIEIYVPVQRDVDPEMDESPTLGAGDRIRRRG